MGPNSLAIAGTRSLTDGQRVTRPRLDVNALPLMHPVTRLGRSIQQLRSFAELHAGELDAFAQELESNGAEELARRLRLFRDMQRDEGQMVIDALVDLQGDVAASADTLGPTATTVGDVVAEPPETPTLLQGEASGLSDTPTVLRADAAEAGETPTGASVSEAERGGPYDPAAHSPRRAKWLAEQAAEAERLRQPFSRRDFFGRGRADDRDHP